jgi:hypothetical protein
MRCIHATLLHKCDKSAAASIPILGAYPAMVAGAAALSEAAPRCNIAAERALAAQNEDFRCVAKVAP